MSAVRTLLQERVQKQQYNNLMDKITYKIQCTKHEQLQYYFEWMQYDARYCILAVVFKCAHK